jgi:MoaA/NifB/PqqE/SkfB family radical SAM enzyme
MLLVYKMVLRRASFLNICRVLGYLMKRYIFLKNVPVTVILGLTTRCQCNCRHCSVSSDKRHDVELTTPEALEFIRQTAGCGCLKVNFFGGEPLLKEGIVDLVSGATREGLFSFLDTNGFLLNKNMVQRLKEAGLSCALISLDSPDEIKHDTQRSLAGIYHKAKEAIRGCVDAGLPCVISTIATPDSISSGALARLIEMAKTMHVTGVRILLPILSGKWESQAHVLPNDIQLNKLDSLLCPGFTYLESGFSYTQGDLKTKQCSALNRDIVYVSPGGDVQACYAFPYVFGNMRQDALENILASMQQHPLYSRRTHHGCIANDPEFKNAFSGYAP